MTSHEGDRSFRAGSTQGMQPRTGIIRVADGALPQKVYLQIAASRGIPAPAVIIARRAHERGVPSRGYALGLEDA